MFETLSDRLATVFSNLRGKGRLTPADIDATAARSASPCSRPTSRCRWSGPSSPRIKERATGADVSAALNPAQQVIKIVNEELIEILGGETRRLRLRQEPADGDHAGRPAGRR